MNFVDRLDPETRAAIEALAPKHWRNLPAARTTFLESMAAMAAQSPRVTGVRSEDFRTPGPAGAPEVMVRVYMPEDRPAVLPGLFWIHGGGYIVGNVGMDDVRMRHLALKVGCVVVSVEYRLAPEHPYPAPIEDCYTGLAWMHAHAAALGVDPRRIAVGGASAGGGLAAALALLARDRAQIPLAFQLLIYPMLDDRNATPASHAIVDPRVWNRDANLFGWECYLGGRAGGDDVPCHAAAGRATDLAGLPPAFVAVGGLDLFVDEDIDYARRLNQAGVATELVVYPGAVHGFDGYAPTARISRRFQSDLRAALGRALHG
ncbi:MAG: alpha/beta hydrolase [Gammaproteobacteria bacterium]